MMEYRALFLKIGNQPLGKHGELSKQILSIIDSSVSKICKAKDVLSAVCDSIHVVLAIKHKYKLATFDRKLKQKTRTTN